MAGGAGASLSLSLPLCVSISLPSCVSLHGEHDYSLSSCTHERLQNLLHVIRQKGRASHRFTNMVIETCAAAGESIKKA